jgi:ABC-2 type transport system permease protein
MSDAQAAGAIYDLGYQRYTGERFGRLYAMRTLFAYSFRAAFGLGRGEKARQVPVIVLVLVYLPALVQIGVASASGMSGFLHYASHLEFTAFLLALFAAAQAPELIVHDKQHGVLSLYLSRPLKATDYALAKLAALTAAMLVITLGPQLVLFVGKVFIGTSPWVAFKGEYTKLLPILGGTLLTSLFFAAIGLALASLAAKRSYASASVIVFFLLMPAAANIFRSLTTGAVRRYMLLVNPVWLITGFANWLFDIEARRRSVVGRAELEGTVYLYTMLIACALATTLLLRRYRKVEA